MNKVKKYEKTLIEIKEIAEFSSEISKHFNQPRTAFSIILRKIDEVLKD